ncbi:SpoIIE family protein phosphatase [Nonomuraea terrae]|uniref:SpoIIE family protein phosphatase n=1 Tax=Nonomuraea terrae TaxID=2530383 RepID=UPI0037A24D84
MEPSDAVPAAERYGLSQELMRALLHGVHLGLYILDECGRIIMINPYAEQVLGRSARELIGADAHDLLHRNPDGSKLPRSQCPQIQALEMADSVHTEETWFVRGDGELIPLGLMGAAIQLDGRLGAVVLFYDLRRHKAIEQEQAAHLSVLEELAGRLSLMAEISTVLASTLDKEEALRRLTRLVVPRLADWAVIDLLGPGGELRRVSIVSGNREDNAIARQWEGVLPASDELSHSPMARVLRGSPSVLLTGHDLASRDGSPFCVFQRRLFDHIRPTSVVIAPLRTPRRVLGAISLARCAPTPDFDMPDLSLIDDIAGRAGLSVDNADMYEVQRRIAETMQRHLISPLPAIEELEMAARYQPAPRGSRVGGDWYDAFPLPGGLTALVIGDVTGHDLQAAADMSQIRNMLRTMAWAERTSPSRVVARLDEALPYIAGDLMATLVLALAERCERGRWRLRWTSAGHPPPLLVGDDGGAVFLEGAEGLLLGTGLAMERTDAVAPIPPGGTVLLYTDGLIENREESLDEGMSRLSRHAAALAGLPLPVFCTEILGRMRNDVMDDVALLALRPRS